MTVASIVSKKYGNVSVLRFDLDLVSEKYGNVANLTFDLDLAALTFGQGHSVRYVVKHIITKYFCAKVGDCSFNSSEKYGNVAVLTFYLDLDRRSRLQFDMCCDASCNKI